MHEAFEAAFNARLKWMTVQSLRQITGFAALEHMAIQESCAIVETLVYAEAYELHTCGVKYGAQVPPMIADIPELTQAYKDSYQCERRAFEQERADSEERKAQARRQAHALECISRGAWDELGMPTPAHFVSELLAGRRLRIDGYCLDYDSSDDVTYFDNPYGVTCGFHGEPNESMAKKFMTRIASGGMYGPEP